MHFNYHRKDNAIQREGFLRFRGAEDCGTEYCMYRDQKTTHFHCNRSSCQFTFKNKADMGRLKGCIAADIHTLKCLFCLQSSELPLSINCTFYEHLTLDNFLVLSRSNKDNLKGVFDRL